MCSQSECWRQTTTIYTFVQLKWNSWTSEPCHPANMHFILSSLHICEKIAIIMNFRCNDNKIDCAKQYKANLKIIFSKNGQQNLSSCLFSFEFCITRFHFPFVHIFRICLKIWRCHSTDLFCNCGSWLENNEPWERGKGEVISQTVPPVWLEPPIKAFLSLSLFIKFYDEQHWFGNKKMEASFATMLAK